MKWSIQVKRDWGWQTIEEVDSTKRAVAAVKRAAAEHKTEARKVESR
jgi:hypothetical protein